MYSNETTARRLSSFRLTYDQYASCCEAAGWKTFSRDEYMQFFKDYQPVKEPIKAYNYPDYRLYCKLTGYAYLSYSEWYEIAHKTIWYGVWENTGMAAMYWIVESIDGKKWSNYTSYVNATMAKAWISQNLPDIIYPYMTSDWIKENITDITSVSIDEFDYLGYSYNYYRLETGKKNDKACLSYPEWIQSREENYLDWNGPEPNEALYPLAWETYEEYLQKCEDWGWNTLSKKQCRQYFEEIGCYTYDDSYMALTLSNFAVIETNDMVYTGSKITSGVIKSVTFKGEELVEGKDYYIVEYSDNVKPGRGSVKIRALEDNSRGISGSMREYFNIIKVDASINVAKATVKLDKTKYAYTGENICPAVKSVKIKGKTLTEGTDYTLTYLNNTDSGTGIVRIMSAQGNKNGYMGHKDVKFTITGTKMSNVKVKGISNMTYSPDTVFEQNMSNLTLTYKGTPLVQGTDFTVSYASNKNAGTAKIVFTGKGRYYGTIKKSFKITKAALRMNMLSDDSKNITMKYTGQALKPEVMLYDGQHFLSKDTDYTLTYSNNKKVSTEAKPAYIIIKGKGNYKDILKVKFTIANTTAENNAKTGTVSNNTPPNSERTNDTATDEPTDETPTDEIPEAGTTDGDNADSEDGGTADTGEIDDSETDGTTDDTVNGETGDTNTGDETGDTTDSDNDSKDDDDAFIGTVSGNKPTAPEEPEDVTTDGDDTVETEDENATKSDVENADTGNDANKTVTDTADLQDKANNNIEDDIPANDAATTPEQNITENVL